MLNETMSDTSRDCYQNHLYAQRLNNSAASCIESGEHDKAVTVLVKALRLSPSPSSSGDSNVDCGCSLDECIVYSEERAAMLQDEKTRPCHEPLSKRRKMNSTERTPLSAKQTYELQEETDSTIGYTHKTPILVTPTIIKEGLDMGPILSLIITFNLALANHLKVLQVVSNNEDVSMSIATRERLGKVLRLYELAYQWENECSNEGSNDSIGSGSHEEQQQMQKAQHVQEHNSSSSTHSVTELQQEHENTGHANNCSSLRFDMIVCNNLSQIHKMAQNYSKQEKCLQHLLSILMFVVDWQRDRVNHSDDFVVEVEVTETVQHQHDSSDESTNNCSAVEQQVEQPQQRQTTKRKRTFMDLDGFWRNISPFLLKNDCAKAA